MINSINRCGEKVREVEAITPSSDTEARIGKGWRIQFMTFICEHGLTFTSLGGAGSNLMPAKKVWALNAAISFIAVGGRRDLARCAARGTLIPYE